MRNTLTILPFVAATVTSGFVIPDEAMTQQLVLETQQSKESKSSSSSSSSSSSWLDRIYSAEDVRASVDEVRIKAEHAFSSAKDTVEQSMDSPLKFEIPDFLAPSWMTGNNNDEDDSGHGGHGRHGHHGHGPVNLTIYQAIAESKYTTKLLKLVDEFPDIVSLLNSTETNLTVFAPTDRAFAKIPKHGHDDEDHKPPKEFLEKLLKYHVVPGLYPAGRVLASSTLPTALKTEDLGDRPQRLRVSVSLFGLRVNFYSKVVAANIRTKNGVIHGVDSILVPPPTTARILNLFADRFSTLLLAFERTGLHKELSDNLGPTTGATTFAPTNTAFQKLGPGINAFLFNTHRGLGYLKAILKYHLVANETLYSDAFYGPQDATDNTMTFPSVETEHVDLPSLLDEKNISVDIARFHGHLLSIRVNGFTHVAVRDGIAEDGVIHAITRVLIPPHPHKGHGDDGDEEMTVAELIERLAPYVENENVEIEDDWVMINREDVDANNEL